MSTQLITPDLIPNFIPIKQTVPEVICPPLFPSSCMDGQYGNQITEVCFWNTSLCTWGKWLTVERPLPVIPPGSCPPKGDSECADKKLGNGVNEFCNWNIKTCEWEAMLAGGSEYDFTTVTQYPSPCKDGMAED